MTTGPDATRPRELFSLQVLRGIAATLVVFHHAARSLTANQSAAIPAPNLWLFSSDKLVAIGASGVDIFFLISGFIMVYVSGPYRSGEKPASDFLIRRIIRIYPLYAIMTLIALVIPAIHFLHHRDGFPEPLTRVLAAFTFVPSFDEHDNVQPIVGQGWTLFYEMFFYICFAAVLAGSKKHLLAPMIGIFSIVLIAARLFGSPNSAVAVFFSDPIMIEFLYGCTIGLLFLRRPFDPSYRLAWLAAAVILLGCGEVINAPDQYRFLFWGLPASVMLIAFLKLDASRITWPKPILLLGDASYSIYLAHVLVIYNFKYFALTHFPTLFTMPGDVLIITFAAAAIGLGLVVYFLIERPVTQALNRLYRERGLSYIAHQA